MKMESENVSTGSASDTLYNAFLKRQPSPTEAELHQCLVHDGLTTPLCRKPSLRDEFGRAASETYEVSKLSFTLLKYLGIGYRWIGKLGALSLYACLLMPGFFQVGHSYLRDKRIRRSIVYGLKSRNLLDLYLPENLDSPKPVVAFITGGAWIIGYRAWGSLMGLQLVEKDVIVACIDYRNFPQGTISDMVEDVMQGISFICNNIGQFGGDPHRIYLAGQSAGAHIAACALIEQAMKEMRVGKGLKSSDGCDGNSVTLTWKASQIRGFFGISGGYNLQSLVDHFHRRGLYRSLFLSVMEGEESLSWFSPELRVKNLSVNAGASLPPIYLFHGTADYSIPCTASESFAEVLVPIGASVTKRFYEGKTHTDIFLQDPMRGGHDVLVADILSVVHAGDQEALAKDVLSVPRRRLVPEFLLQLARSVSPF
ncbi:hypothetical protein GOP47_0021042 [Adiantum capillus-veneris]|uniref:protein-S-isoprenylcysteine alpha-carbonyl methylesterase n=1 Tax=Adiantum capillus-veneris TaxID=13818 RepID=A0A9D4Z8A5_ADICA|nr:hypothetical protein GOP47_0021042 [Adiantum capillus-veneris]